MLFAISKIRRLSLFLLFVVTTCNTFGQDTADYLRNPTIPPFTLLKNDSTKLTLEDIAKDKKTVIMLFSPDCGHCRQQTDSIIANINKLKDIEIVMTTFQPLEQMDSFYKEYKLEKYSNIKVGRDTRYFFIPFFEPTGIPFLALYNEKRRFVTAFTGGVSITDILSAYSRRPQ